MNGNTSGTNGAPPPEIQILKWNWGAFTLPGFWLIAHNRVLAGVVVLLTGLLELVIKNANPPLHWLIIIGRLVYVAILAAQGNMTAWQNRHFDSVDEFFQVQNAWLNWSIAWWAIMAFILMVSIVAVENQPRMPFPYLTHPNQPFGQ